MDFHASQWTYFKLEKNEYKRKQMIGETTKHAFFKIYNVIIFYHEVQQSSISSVSYYIYPIYMYYMLRN